MRVLNQPATPTPRAPRCNAKTAARPACGTSAAGDRAYHHAGPRFSFSSTPLAGDVANAYLDIGKHEVVEEFVGYLPIEMMLRVANNFSVVARRMFASARTPLLR